MVTTHLGLCVIFLYHTTDINSNIVLSFGFHDVVRSSQETYVVN
jgi:hypothetical protein